MKGDHIIEWDGTNYNGSRVSSGTYVICLVEGISVYTQKTRLIN